MSNHKPGVTLYHKLAEVSALDSGGPAEKLGATMALLANLTVSLEAATGQDLLATVAEGVAKSIIEIRQAAGRGQS